MSASNQLFLKPALMIDEVIDHYWFIDVIGVKGVEFSDHSQVHLPGSYVDWYFCYHGSTHQTQLNGISIGSPGSIMAGTRSIDKVLTTSDFSIPFRGLRVRFKPTGFYKLFGIPADEIYNCIYTIDEVLGEAIKHTELMLELAIDHNERKDILDKYFISRLNQSVHKNLKTERCLEAVKNITSNAGKLSKPSLLKQLNISPRTLERDFKLALGISPKELSDTIRINNIIKELMDKDVINMKDLIYENGYYDQSHLINDLKKAITVTPDWLFKNKNEAFIIANSLLFFVSNNVVREAAQDINQGYNAFVNDETSVTYALIKTPENN